MKKKTQQKTVCIVGAGIGGLTTGALLARDGYTVHLLNEKNSLVVARSQSPVVPLRMTLISSFFLGFI